MQIKKKSRLWGKLSFVLISLLVVISAVVIAGHYKDSQSPLPADIKQLVSYRVIYPQETKMVATQSFHYDRDQQALSFNVVQSGKQVVFIQQPAPSSLGTGDHIYYQALGIHPYAQFSTKLGPVALTKFWQSGSLKPAGQTAVLASKGTMLIATCQKGLTNAEWKDLFDSLEISR